jgi:hypothetical protein
MRFVTETRFKLLGELIQSIRCDIDENYAEIESPISLSGIRRRPNQK